MSKLNLFVLVLDIVIDPDSSFICDSIKADFNTLKSCDLHTAVQERKGSFVYTLMRRVLIAAQDKSLLVNASDLDNFRETLFVLAARYNHTDTDHYLLMSSEFFQYQIRSLQKLDTPSLRSHIQKITRTHSHRSKERDNFMAPILYGLMQGYNKCSNKHSEFALSCKGCFLSYYDFLSQLNPSLKNFLDRVVSRH